jgi:dihydroorotase
VSVTARQFGAAIVMPNLKPPITTVELALRYQQRIIAALNHPESTFKPHMCLYLTEHTTPDDVKQVAEQFKDNQSIIGFKLYPAGATTHSDAGVRDLLAQCKSSLEAMQRLNVPLLVHGEVTDPLIDIFDREAVFIERVMRPLRHAYPALKVVFEHITTSHAAQYVQDAPSYEPIAATITPQHLLYNRNAVLMGGIRPHYYCLPILKRESHRLALLNAATSGNPRFFLGTDTAPHAQHLKEHACGCAGCYTGLHALELYATAFDSVNALDKLNAFASQYAAAFYCLSPLHGVITLRKNSWIIPNAVMMGETRIIPLAAGEMLEWQCS